MTETSSIHTWKMCCLWLFVFRYVSISSLSFSADAQFLCASSNTETVHIFRLQHHSPRYTQQHPITKHVYCITDDVHFTAELHDRELHSNNHANLFLYDRKLWQVRSQRTFRSVFWSRESCSTKSTASNKCFINCIVIPVGGDKW